jgi:hypothetical protein
MGSSPVVPTKIPVVPANSWCSRTHLVSHRGGHGFESRRAYQDSRRAY